jgi:AraC-like DNA-binding protein
MEGLDDPIHTAYQTLGAVQRLMGEKAEATPEAQAFLQASTAQIFLLLTLRTAKRVGSEESNTVLRVIEYVNSHLNEELSLDDIARDFFISKYHLCRIFHKQTGASIFTYYNTKRMALAQQMINSGESATAVALRLGFRDYSTFYRTFRKQTGHSPVRKIPQKELEEAK